MKLGILDYWRHAIPTNLKELERKVETYNPKGEKTISQKNYI